VINLVRFPNSIKAAEFKFLGQLFKTASTNPSKAKEQFNGFFNALKRSPEPVDKLRLKKFEPVKELLH
jgi:hypothetical protein